jgi:hypothetical protein
MKTKTRLVLFLLVVLIALAAALAFSGKIPGIMDMTEEIRSIFKKSPEPPSMTGIILEEVRNLYSFHTVEYIYKTVFPFDYLDPHLSIESINATLRKPDSGIDDLYEFEQEYYAAWVLANNLGFNLDENDYTFIVITVRVIGGFDLSDTLYKSGEEREEWELKQLIRISTEITGEGEEIKAIKLKLPPAAITEVILEDMTSEMYDYPDIRIDPESWKKLSAFIETRVRKKVLEEGILEAAENNGRGFLEGFLRQAGFAEIEFF